MNRERITAEVPSAVAAWLADASPELWDAVARDVALRFGHVLLDGQQDFAEEDGWRRDGLAGSASPAVRHVVAALPRDRRWTPHGVATVLCAHLELFGMTDWLRREIHGTTNATH